ncbi:ankyrin [Corynespora cassiicola Philippines]|uniref:Ankyrin n=1 Tax=Corynespora cassiicola Philippines TaxID=1448308 RepID=A0A2T2P4U6_CORCC|nr:ankyrin [Corynespora cassiicola Philippines]
MLLKYGVGVDEISDHGRSAFHWAVSKLSADTVRMFIVHGVDIYFSDRNGSNTIHYAAKREVGSRPTSCALLNTGIGTLYEPLGPNTLHTLLDTALRFFDGRSNGCFRVTESVGEVLKSGPGSIIRWLFCTDLTLQATDERFGLLLQMVAAARDKEYMQLLIERNVNVNMTGRCFGSALVAAARFSRTGCAKLLVEVGTDIHRLLGYNGNDMAAPCPNNCYEKRTTLLAAVEGGELDTLRLILAPGVDTNAFPQYNINKILEETFIAGNSVIINFTIGADAVVHSTQDFEMALSVQAVRFTDLQIAQRPIGQGIDVNKKGQDDINTLSAAYASQNIAAVKLLIDVGADVNSSPVEGAIGTGNVDMLRLTIDAGLDTDSTSCSYGLAFAQKIGTWDAVLLLLSLGVKEKPTEVSMRVAPQLAPVYVMRGPY